MSESCGRILVVDDEPGVRRLLTRSLVSAGLIAIEADDGTSALRIVEASDHVFDILVTDIRMPRMGGLELAAKMREISPSTDILYMSGHGDPFTAEEVKGGARFLQKPFTLDLLLDTVRPILTARGSPAPE